MAGLPLGLIHQSALLTLTAVLPGVNWRQVRPGATRDGTGFPSSLIAKGLAGDLMLDGVQALIERSGQL